MNKVDFRRREFLRVTLGAGVAAIGLNAAERNIYWGLGLVTWKGKSNWPEILKDVDAAGFDGVEPFSAKLLTDDAMAELTAMVGLIAVKDQIRSIAASVEAARRRAIAGHGAEKPNPHTRHPHPQMSPSVTASGVRVRPFRL